MRTTTSPLSTGVWYHVIGVIDFANDSAAIYVDGIAQALDITPSYTNTETPNTSSDDASIGAEDDGSNGYFDGRIDEARVSLGARTASWAMAQNLSMRDSFVTYGGVESAPALSGALANDSDADGDLINAQLVAGPANATAFTFNRDGTFDYTPQTGFVGTDTFIYRLTDDLSFGQDYATVTITVGVVPDLIVDTTSDLIGGDTSSIAALLLDKGADGLISLREAITATNNTVNTSGPDVIHFNIGGGGLQTINLIGSDPGITDAVIIDGTSQPGFSGEPIIQLYGDGASDAGLELRALSDGSTIRGLIISNFGVHGIRIESSNNVIAGNWIGLDADGISAAGNGARGIYLLPGADNNTIGGLTSQDRNVISGNTGNGIQIRSNNNVVIGNYIGTDKSGTVVGLGNGNDGIRIRNGGAGNRIGGTTVAERNIIADNAGDGVTITDGGTGNQILGNSIYANSGIGIDLGNDGVTLNDVGDGDPGSNNLQNYPVLTNVTWSSTDVTIDGDLNSAASTTYRVELFANTTVDSTGYGEGEIYLGFVDVTTDGSGNASFSKNLTVVLPAGASYTATATDPSGNTSEFSLSHGLVAHYRLNEGAGVTAIDSSGRGLDGSWVNGSGYAAGVSGTAADLAGAGNLISVADDDALDIGLEDFSIDFWFNTTQDPGWSEYPELIYKRTSNDGYEIFLWRDGNDTDINLDFKVHEGGSDWSVTALGSVTPVNDGQWHHVVAVKTSTEIQLYLDGAFIGSDSNAFGNLNVANPFEIGGHDDLPADGVGEAWANYDGLIDEVSVYNRALNAAEAAELAGGFSSGISGTVYEDVDGDGDVLDDGIGASGVTVNLYRDDGDGTLNAGDTFVTFTTTDGSGNYVFTSLTDDTYWVVADSKTIDPTAGFNGGFVSGDAWAEQTYGSVNSVSWNGSGFDFSVSDGTFYSGMKSNLSDDASGLLTAEHVIRATVAGASVTGVDWGFSFNAVTNTLAGDTQDDDANPLRTVQGSLRQFIDNANAVNGANAMRFVPTEATNATDGGGNDWWRISVTQELPQISDANTIIDGTAYSSADGTTVLNTNSTLLGYVGDVGLGADAIVGTGDELSLSGVQGPELEIINDRATNVVAHGLDLQASDITVRNLAISGFGDASVVEDANIRVGTGVSPRFTGIIIEDNVIGSGAASFTDPGAANRTARSNIGLFNTDAGFLRDNLIGFAGYLGVATGNSTTWTIQGNEIRGNGLIDNGYDGIDIAGGSSGFTVSGNLLAANQGSGIDSWQGLGGNLIENNSFEQNGQGLIETAAMRIFGTGNTIQLNDIHDSQGAGVLVVGDNVGASQGTPSTQNLIRKNRFSNNGSNAIDLLANAGDVNLGDGVSLNDGANPLAGNLGLDYPLITGANKAGATTTIDGTTGANFTVEFYRSVAGAGDNNGGNNYGEGVEYLGTAVADGAGSFTFNTNALIAGDEVSTIAIDAVNNTLEFGQNFTVVSGNDITFDVSSTASISENLTETETFTVTLGGDPLLGGNTASVDIDATGTALSGVDYDDFVAALVTQAALTTGVIFDGTDTLTFDSSFNGGSGTGAFNFTVDATNDSTVEGTETIVATLSNESVVSGTAMLGTFTTTTNVTDTDSALVSITANDPTAGEPADPGQFTVTMTNPSSTDTTVSYSVGGSATPGAGNDYTTLSGTVTISAGATSATIDVTVLDDGLLEGLEDVVVTLTGISAGDPDVSVDGSNDTATVNISDNEATLVSITANDPNADEAGSDPGQFTVDLGTVNNTGGDITVSYTVTGSATGADYTALSGSVVIGNGLQFATINVAGVIDDGLLEGDETVIVTLTGTDFAGATIDPANDADTVTIADNEATLVSITANDPNAAEAGSDPGQFTVDLGTVNNTGGDITVSYTVTGSATGADYTVPSGTVVISNGLQFATINVAGIIDDGLLEGDETVIVTLTGTDYGPATIDPANDADTVTIADNEATLVSITANDPNAAEAGSDPGQFTVDLGTVNNTGGDITVSYTVTGSATGADYTVPSGTVVISNGLQFATINVAGIIDDGLLEGDETVIVTLTGTDYGPATIDPANDADTVTIADNEATLVSITANDPNAAEAGSDPGQFTVDLGMLNNTGGDITVSYTVTGSATGADYTALSGTVVIGNGLQFATIDVAGVIDDGLLEGDETVIVTLTGTDLAGATIDPPNDNDTVTIADNEATLVSITANDSNAAEAGSDPGQFTVDLGAVNNTGGDITVSYTVTGSATGADYTALSGSVVIGNGLQFATINVAGVIDDGLL